MKLRGVICDLDGTLIDSRVDFARIRAELRIPASFGILEYIENKLERSEVAAALAVVDRFETEAARRALLIPGVQEFLSELRLRDLRLAVLTRNSTRTARTAMERLGIQADILIAREDAPPKPDPAGVERILQTWNFHPGEAILVGDYRYDIEAGLAAGVRTILYTPADAELPEFGEQANWIIRHFSELMSLLNEEGKLHGA